MTPHSGPWGIVGLAALDLRRRPDHRSELRSQLLMGEIVRRRRSGPGGRWWEIENLSDGYRGWVRTWGVVVCSRSEARAWVRKATARVIVRFAEVLEAPGAGALVSPLCWNDRVVPGRATGRHRRVELPDGRRAWVARETVETGRRRAFRGVQRKRFAGRILSLLGTPYLWGGRTPMGLDCSGFTQLVLAEHGIWLPRDAAQQYMSAQRLRPGVTLRLGDLIFFGPRKNPPTHVGIALGGGYFAHARGAVRVNSLEPSNPLFDNVLAAQFRGYGRPSRRLRSRLRA